MRRRTGVFTLIFWCLSPGWAAGQDGHNAASGAVQDSGTTERRADVPRHVAVFFSIDPDGAERIERVLRGMLVALEATLSTQSVADFKPNDVLEPPPPGAQPAIARVWIRSGDKNLYLFVVNKSWDRVLHRTIPLANGIDDVAIEETSHVVFTATEALLAGADVGVTRPEFEASQRGASEHSPSTPMSKAVGADTSLDTMSIGLRFALRSLGPVGARTTVGLYGGARLGTGPVELKLGVTVGAILPGAIHGAPVSIDVFGAGARGIVGASWWLSNTTELSLGVGGGVDVEYVEPQSVSTIDVVPGATKWVPFAMGTACLKKSIWGVGFVAASFELHVDILDVRYVVETSSGTASVADPWSVQPGVAVFAGGEW